MGRWPAQLGNNDTLPTASQGGTLTFDLPARPSLLGGNAAPRVTIYDAAGSVYAANTAATIEGPATLPTLTQGTGKTGVGASVDAPLAVSSTTSIAARMKLMLGTPGAARPPEVVKVKAVLDATHLLLFGPVLHAHEAGAVMGGIRLTATIAAGTFSNGFRRGRAVWEWGSEGSSTRDQGAQSAVDAVRYPLKMLATEDHLRLVDAAWYAKIVAARDPLEIIERGWDEVGARLWANNGFGFVSSDALAMPTVYYGAWLETFGWGEKWQERAEAWRRLADEMLERAVAVNPVDPDEDGYISPYEERTAREIRLVRAN